MRRLLFLLLLVLPAPVYAQVVCIGGGCLSSANTSPTFTGTAALERTITTAGTVGAQTINKMGGTVNIAAAQTSIVVTNNKVTTSSIIFAVIRTNDTTAILKNVVPASGSFTITLTAAATAETSIGFFVTN